MRKICVVTGNRSEYSRLKSVMKAIIRGLCQPDEGCACNLASNDNGANVFLI